MKLKVKKLDELAIIPCYAHKGDAGLDLFSIDELTINAGESKLIHTGISIELPSGTEAQIRPRSGLALKHGVTCLNTPGLIDSGYRGELKVILVNTDPKEAFQVNKGERIAQLVIQKVEECDFQEVDELPDSERGETGFGSSGR